jgi:dolichol kinase
MATPRADLAEVTPETARDTKDIGLAAEVGRKAIHLFALVIPLGLLTIPRAPALVFLGVSLAVSIAVDLIRRRSGAVARVLNATVGKVLRPHEDGHFSGATYILAAGFLCPLLYSVPIAAASLIFIIMGDTAAVFLGRFLGHVRMGRKSLEGSLGFFVFALLGVAWMTQLPISVRVTGAAVAAIVEALPVPVDDNLSVPLVSGAVMTFLLS